MPIKYLVKGKEKTFNYDQIANAMEEQLNEDASKKSVDFFWDYSGYFRDEK